jgi:hypothetical protein
MVSLYYSSGTAPSIGTPLTCEVTCQAGQGRIRMKFGSQFASIDEGTASSTVDEACPFSVTLPYETAAVGYALVYSSGSSIENATITCSSPTLSPTLGPTPEPTRPPTPGPTSAPRPPSNPLTPAPFVSPADDDVVGGYFLSSFMGVIQSFWNKLYG